MDKSREEQDFGIMHREYTIQKIESENLIFFNKGIVSALLEGKWKNFDDLMIRSARKRDLTIINNLVDSGVRSSDINEILEEYKGRRVDLFDGKEPLYVSYFFDPEFNPIWLHGSGWSPVIDPDDGHKMNYSGDIVIDVDNIYVDEDLGILCRDFNICTVEQWRDVLDRIQYACENIDTCGNLIISNHSYNVVSDLIIEGDLVVRNSATFDFLYDRKVHIYGNLISSSNSVVGEDSFECEHCLNFDEWKCGVMIDVSENFLDEQGYSK